MKSIFLSLIFFSFLSATAQNTFPTGAGTNVGIGTLTPTAPLDVIGTVKSKNLFATNNSTSSSTFASSSLWYKDINVFGAGYEMPDATMAGATRRMLNFYDIYGWAPAGSPGTDNFKLNIVDRNNKERLSFTGSKTGGASNGFSNFVIFDKNQTEIFKLGDNGSQVINLQMAKPNTRLTIGGFADYAPGLPHKFVIQSGSALIEGNILTNSNIGVGTTNFTDGTETYRVSVNGAIRANRVRVYTTWADYVFQSDYDLPTLEEVEKHIEQKGHLKDIPSAAEVEEKGIEVGEMNKLLLQKVEELTLYIIEMNKELQDIKSQVKSK